VQRGHVHVKWNPDWRWAWRWGVGSRGDVSEIWISRYERLEMGWW
jgi:hypothetical protein